MTPATDRLADKIIPLSWTANPFRDHMEWSQQPNMKSTPAFARGANSIGAGSGVKNLREWRGSKQALRLVIHGNLVQVHVVVARGCFCDYLWS